MAASPYPGGPSPPSQAQLALAIAILKSKPPHTTIKDYILCIRNYIKTGQRERDESSQEYHLDSTAFWREAYEKSEAAQSRLLDRIYELEQRNGASALNVEPESGSKAPLRKRKTNGSPGSIALRPPKRSKTTADEKINIRKANSKFAASELGIAAGFLENATTPFLRRVHTLRKLLHRPSEPELLVTTCADICANVEQLIRLSIGPNRTKTMNSDNSSHIRSQNPGLLDILIVFEQCYPLLLQALRKVAGKDKVKNNKGIIHYHLVHLFQFILLQLHQHVLAKAKAISHLGKVSTKKGRQVPRTKTTNPLGQPLAQLSREDSQTLDSISRVLATMILSINTSRYRQIDLLEGFLFILLEHIGQMLGLVVFKELRSNSDLRTCPSKLPLPCPLAKEPTSRIEPTILEHAAVLQSYHLIWIFEQALSTLDRCGDHLKSGVRGCNITSTTSPFLAHTKKKLQNTLLRGVFGEDDAKFQDSLKLPRPVVQSRGMNGSADNIESSGENNGDWFIQELWRLLGWNTLMDNREPSTTFDSSQA
ncbi:hypothetical protein D8B26_007710 [Coccidioides posadasii str. Silveira]|uniref:Uncharacterized protein n=1 Tax=Coccidioides posadasii (strain RMSCC 757 / Silveira) TaxID=443226 RepID=E9D2S0_COCPS|nr:conserved hypothetical protein [Coccidioides posadasii str. Silveira]QVM13094.1 hypothetical protein D8B26_007710 [Coccidioides posadasii str. Silveira]